MASSVDWQSHTFLSDVAYQIARGEHSTVKKKLTKLLSRGESCVREENRLTQFEEKTRVELMKARDKYGQSVLHLCADGSCLDMIEMLLPEKKSE